MSPLVRPLLALAALLAAAQAQSNCNELYFGQKTGSAVQLPPAYVPPPGAQLDIPDNCAAQGRGQLYGQWVQVCNNNPYGLAPSLDGTNYSVSVNCRDSCPSGATANVIQYCAY